MTEVLFASVFILLVINSINHLKANDDSVECGILSVKSGCLCLGSSIVYQCAVNASIEGLTVWEATGCNQDVILDHNDFVNVIGTGCLNVYGKGISINNSCYVSELTIENVGESNIGGNVTCSLDVGSSPIVIGHRMLSIPILSDTHSLNNLHQITSSQASGELSFTWDPLAIIDCPSLRYNITAKGCGLCPTSVSNNVATCVNTTRGKNCTISVLVDLCGDQIRSNTIAVSTGDLSVFTNLHRIDSGSAEELMFTWDLMNFAHCPSITYTINATKDCGECSVFVDQQENTATCRNIMRGSVCTFSVQANVCGDQIRSDAIVVNTGSSVENQMGNSIGSIIGITLGVTTILVGVTIAVIVIVVALKSYCNRQHKQPSTTLELQPVGEGGDPPVVPAPPRRPHVMELSNTDRPAASSSDSPAVLGKFISKVAPVALGNGLKQATLNEVTTITILLSNDNKAAASVQGELVVLSDSRNIPIQCKINELEPNERYELEYTPTIRGQHKLHIKVNDEQIHGSPYSVIVKPSVHMLGTPIRTISGVNQPISLTVNDKGEILVVEGGKQCVSIFSPGGINLCSFGSPTQLAASCLREPQGVAVCKDGTVLVADSGKHCISLFTSKGEFIKSVGKRGNGRLQFNKPMGIDIHPITKDIYVTEYKNHRVQVLSPKFQFITSFGSQGKEHEKFRKPWDISFDSKGDVYIADSGNHRIQVFEHRDDKFYFLRAIGEKGRREGQLMWPSSVFVDDENRVYVTEDDNYRVSVFTHLGKFLKSFGKKGKSEGEFDLPHGIVTDMNGDIYISDHKNNRLQVF